ncbi:amino acid ABC transporter substrate-binding protein [Verminephrobacter aporrectodeae subsp. tuberculatae]|uniref:transporter substrate-binding domain-containing protein n=1 Tax=Verminephrobacter aporrectodeae TaxID=1110389 RepID=UPI0022371D7C|nr:transporter substrate-binding domain-containing protein [Verminephrobacter aporrectodeae]MCW5257502.1 amino acid ABC transporter substrate-binding protein [Verminephrobacter aporrectodeae subsp. tuberculatae]
MTRLKKIVTAACFIVLSAAAHADDLDKVKQSGRLTFALTGKYPPFSFIDAAGQLQGFDVDIGSQIAKKIGVQAVPVTTAWDGIVGGLLAGKYHAIIGSMAITDERLRAVDFTQPYYRSGAQLFVPKGSGVEGIDQLNGKVLGVTLGETYEGWLRKNRPEVQIKTYKGLPDILIDLQNRRIDGFVTDKIAGILTIRDKQINAKPVGALLYPEKIGIAVRKDSPRLREAIDAALGEIARDGAYGDMSRKWLGTDVR